MSGTAKNLTESKDVCGPQRRPCGRGRVACPALCYTKLSHVCHCKDEADDTACRLPSDDELGRRFRLTSSSAIAASSSSDRSSLLSYLLYGEKRQPCAMYDTSLPHAASTRPRYGGDGFRGRVRYSGWYWVPTKYGWSEPTNRNKRFQQPNTCHRLPVPVSEQSLTLASCLNYAWIYWCIEYLQGHVLIADWSVAHFVVATIDVMNDIAHFGAPCVRSFIEPDF